MVTADAQQLIDHVRAQGDAVDTWPTAAEIIEALDIDPGAIGPTLSELARLVHSGTLARFTPALLIEWQPSALARWAEPPTYTTPNRLARYLQQIEQANADADVADLPAPPKRQRRRKAA